MSLPRLLKPFQPFNGAYIHDLVTDWYASEWGRKVLALEKSVLDQILPQMFGYYLLQTGLGRPQLLTESSTIKHKFFAGEELYTDAPMACIKSRVSELAIDSDSIDVALIHHSLDFDSNPHKTLREISRTVMPGGKMIIVGFNPWSVWGFLRLFHGQTARVPWSGNFLSPYRVSDWLNLLDFQVEGCECVAHGIPNVSPKWSNSLRWLESLSKRWWSQGGAIYTLVATKRIATVTPIKPARRSAKSTLVAIPLPGIARPSSRNDKANQDSPDRLT